MASAKVYKMDGSESGSVELNDAIFGVEVNPALVHQVAVALMNARRQGTASTKTRKEVRGGGAKPFRQKGLGRARQGSSREPQMRGGGTVFGPHPRSYRQDIPVSFRRKALCCMLSDRVRQESLCILDSLTLESPKTKEMAKIVGSVARPARKTLVITAETNQNVLLSARNLPRVNVTTASDLNALDILDATKVIVLQDAISKLEERLS